MSPSVETTGKIDLFKKHKDEYAAKKGKPALVKVSKGKYLAIQGQGAPGGAEFEECIGAMYANAYTLKFACKDEGRDFAVCKLEMLYWAGDPEHPDFENTPKEEWEWKMLIRVPDFVSKRELKSGQDTLVSKRKSESVRRVRLETLAEGSCVQVLHVGPYDQIGETVERLRTFADEQGYAFAGLHHEIYLSDPRRVAPEKLKTIIREPVRKK